MIEQAGIRKVEANRLVLVGVNAKGRAVGQDHPRATLSDADVDLVFELRAEGLAHAAIAERLECSKTQVWRILNGQQRAQRPERFVRRRTQR